MASGVVEPVLVVGGATKSATTSLFAWLAGHPAVRPARLKESRFFLAPEETPGREAPPARDAASFERLFEPKRGATLRVEATSEYLYSATAARRIRDELPGARVVFSLREPASRLFSWYRFARQGGRLPADETFERFVAREREAGPRPAHELDGPLRQGRYTAYLRRFLDALGPERVHVLFFEDLVADPGAVVAELCRFAGLDPAFFEGYRFASHNPTPTVRSAGAHRAYRGTVRAARSFARSAPWLQRALRPLRRVLERAYLRVNALDDADESMGAEVRHALIDFYRDDVAALRALLGAPVPWPDYDDERR